jgi:hypothetical protein
VLFFVINGIPYDLLNKQAAAHIKIIKCSFGKYIKCFKKRRLTLLKKEPINARRLAVRTTWDLNIQKPFCCQL